MNYRPNYDAAITLQISNDTYYYLAFEEEPLDDDCIDEANEVSAMFPNGFIVDTESAEMLEDGIVQATFIPYVKDTQSWDLCYQEPRPEHVIMIKVLSETEAIVSLQNELTGKVFGEYKAVIKHLTRNKPYLHYPSDMPENRAHGEVPLWTNKLKVLNANVLSILGIKQ